jgi:hypothetical protein
MSKGALRSVLPSPDFTCDLTDHCKFVAGVRPYRKKTFRLEAETRGNKFVVHNYGHGGAGITMSWGCADAVRTIIRQAYPPGPTQSIAVLGAGVMGLTAATLLHEGGYSVSIYAELLSGTTSDVAGGQWAPSIVEFESSTRFFDILKTSYKMHRAKLGSQFGVSERVNYCKKRGKSLEKVAGVVIPPARRLTHLPFQHLNKPGWAYDTLLVEPPIFLERLRNDLRSHVRFLQRKFTSDTDVFNGLVEPIIVNCTGLGSKALFNDTMLVPITGQLALVKSQRNLTYLYSTDETYVFPRADHVVVGGSYEVGVDNSTADDTRCRQILQMAVNVFNGLTMKAADRLPWMMRNK